MSKSKTTHKGKNNPDCNQKMTSAIWELESQKEIIVVQMTAVFCQCQLEKFTLAKEPHRENSVVVTKNSGNKAECASLALNHDVSMVWSSSEGYYMSRNIQQSQRETRGAPSPTKKKKKIKRKCLRHFHVGVGMRMSIWKNLSWYMIKMNEIMKGIERVYKQFVHQSIKYLIYNTAFKTWKYYKTQKSKQVQKKK